MFKKDIVFAALAATLLSAGTAHAVAAAGCMERCAEYFGEVLEDGNGTTYVLTSCTEQANRSGSLTTCVYES